jgi:hypothetical protein
MISKGVPPATNEESSKEEDDRRQRMGGRLEAKTPHPHVQHTSRRPMYVEASEDDGYDEGLEEPDLYAHPRVPNAIYGRDTYKDFKKSRVHGYG